MSDDLFMLLMNLMMVSDPWPLSEHEQTLLNEALDLEASKRGYESWIDAIHLMPEPEKAKP